MPRSGRPSGAGDAHNDGAQQWLFETGVGPEGVPGPRDRRMTQSNNVLPVPPTGDSRELAARLPPGLRLGTSSWAFPGWRGLVYAGEHSPTQLARNGLGAYSAHPLLRAVGLDRTYYAPMPAAALGELAAQVPDGFEFLVKAYRGLTQPGEPAPGHTSVFLDAAYAAHAVVTPVQQGLATKAGPVVFQFSPMDLRRAASVLVPPGHGPRTNAAAAQVLVDRLGEFLRELPSGSRYAVELRSPAMLTARYVRHLAAAGVSHVYNVHPSMPPPSEQATVADPRQQPMAVVRWMLHEGEEYEAAKERYAPFDRLVDEAPLSRREVAAICRAATALGRAAIVIINNKAEGSAPASVRRLVEEILAGAGGE